MRTGGVFVLLAALVPVLPARLPAEDCNRNGIDDAAEIRSGLSPDCNANGSPDECDLSARVSYSVDGLQGAGAAADLNGDGFPDLAFATRSPDGVAVLLNHGIGTFAAPRHSPIDQSPESLAIGDLDADGDMDIIVSGFGRCPLIRLLNQGDGINFIAGGCAPGNRIIFEQESIADFDRDGRMDLAAFDPSRQAAIILLNQSDGEFQESLWFGRGGYGYMLAEDFDSDGDADLLAPIWLFSNDGSGRFRGPILHDSHRVASTVGAAGDFDADGDIDLAFIKDSVIRVLLNDGFGRFPVEKGVDVIRHYTTSMAAGDFDGDGDADLAAMDQLTGGIMVLLSDGRGGFSLAQSRLGSGSPLPADVDGDGDQDLIIVSQGSGELRVLLSRGGLLFDHSLDKGRHRNGIPDECEECLLGDNEIITDDFRFIFSSDQGAAGDVVAVDVSLAVEGFHGRMGVISFFGCYDAEAAELLEPVRYTESFDRLSWYSNFFRLGTLPQPMSASGGLGFHIHAAVHEEVAGEMFSPGLPVHLATLYFRLKGDPGDSFPVRICDNEFKFHRTPEGGGGACLRSELVYHDNSPDSRFGLYHALSTRHLPGTVRILPGAPTRPGLPDIPPDARVYPKREVEETARIRFELTGGVAQPGTTLVPVKVHATSNLEFSGFLLEVKFPPRYLELARVEEPTRPGLVSIDNVSGRLGVAMMNSTRRIGAENERVHLATLIFNVRNEAREVRAIPLEFDESGMIKNRLVIRTRESLVDLNRIPDVSEVAPITMIDAALRIGSGAAARLGDSNLDGSFDVTDSINVLSHLFSGGSPPECFEAADFAVDGELNVTDAIRMLSALFLGDPPRRDWENREVLCH